MDMLLDGEEVAASSVKVMVVVEKLDHCGGAEEVVMGDVGSGGAEEILMNARKSSGLEINAAELFYGYDLSSHYSIEGCRKLSDSYQLTLKLPDSGLTTQEELNSGFSLSQEADRERISYPDTATVDHTDADHGSTDSSAKGRIDENLSAFSVYKSIDNVELYPEIYKPVNQEVAFTSVSFESSPDKDDNLRDPELEKFQPEMISTIELGQIGNKRLIIAAEDSGHFSLTQVEDDQMECTFIEEVSCYDLDMPQDVGEDRVQAKDREVFDDCDEANVVLRTEFSNKNPSKTFQICKEIDYQIEAIVKSEFGSNKNRYEGTCYDLDMPQDVGEDRVQAKDREVFDDCDEANVVLRTEFSNKNPSKTFQICKEIDYQIEAIVKSEFGSNKNRYEGTGISLDDDLQICEENDLQMESNVKPEHTNLQICEENDLQMENNVKPEHTNLQICEENALQMESNVKPEHTTDESSEQFQDQTSSKMADDQVAVDCDCSIQELDSTDEVSKRNASCLDEVDGIENESLVVVSVINRQNDILIKEQWSDAASTDSIAGVVAVPSRKDVTSISVMIPSEPPCPVDVREFKKTIQFTSQDVCSNSNVDERKTDKEITVVDVASCTTSETLKNLLVEANLASKQKGQTALQWSVAEEEEDVFVRKETCSDHQLRNRSSMTRTVYKEWNSPARLPSTTRKAAKEKSKGKPQWVPLICCSYVDQPLRKNFS